jgi:hypothetical protein
VQKFYWNADGAPNFGIPIPDGLHPVRLRSHNVPDRYLRHWEFRARLDPNVTALADSQFRIVPGLAGGGSVSLESTNYPGSYLRHRNNEAWVDRADGTALFNADASFQRRSGLADATGVSFESVNFPGRYLRHVNYLLRLETAPDAPSRGDATFHLE